MRVTLILNQQRRDLDLQPRRVLTDALREDCGLVSAHRGCVDGTCGACTVLLDGETVRSCLMLAVQCDGAHVRTVEGLARDHPLRAVLCASGSAGCGSCLPGLVMLTAGAVARDPGLAREPDRLHRLLESNVCPCTGHGAIRSAVVRAVVQEQR